VHEGDPLENEKLTQRNLDILSVSSTFEKNLLAFILRMKDYLINLILMLMEEMCGQDEFLKQDNHCVSKVHKYRTAQVPSP
jgi:hypothetical protein